MICVVELLLHDRHLRTKMRGRALPWVRDFDFEVWNFFQSTVDELVPCKCENMQIVFEADQDIQILSYQLNGHIFIACASLQCEPPCSVQPCVNLECMFFDCCDTQAAEIHRILSLMFIRKFDVKTIVVCAPGRNLKCTKAEYFDVLNLVFVPVELLRALSNESAADVTTAHLSSVLLKARNAGTISIVDCLSKCVDVIWGRKSSWNVWAQLHSTDNNHKDQAWLGQLWTACFNMHARCSKKLDHVQKFDALPTLTVCEEHCSVSQWISYVTLEVCHNIVIPDECQFNIPILIVVAALSEDQNEIQALSSTNVILQLGGAVMKTAVSVTLCNGSHNSLRCILHDSSCTPFVRVITPPLEALFADKLYRHCLPRRSDVCRSIANILNTARKRDTEQST